MIGQIVIFITQLVTVYLWYLAKQKNPATSWEQIGTQIMALVGTMCLAWTYVLGVRHKITEKIFGGLDRLYKTHHVLGALGFIAIVGHILLLIIRALPANRVAMYLIPGSRLSFNYGMASFYIMLVLLVFTFYIRLPYRLWKWSHEWMGLVIIFGGMHAMLIRSDTLSYMPIRYWIMAWSIIATIAFLYKRFIYYFYPKAVKYSVLTTEEQGDLLIMRLESVGQAIEFKPGQYGFFALKSNKRDEHPLSILSSDGRDLTLGIKELGKFTHKLATLPKGEEILVRGPFGLLAEKMENTKHAVWIAGGIGVTPFLSMAKNVAKDQIVDMYFCATVMPAQVVIAPFAKQCESNPNFRWLPCETSKTGRLIGQNIFDQTGKDKDAMYLLCGPKQMMESLTSQFARLGIKRSHIIYEDFSFK